MKASLKHGEFMSWVAANCTFGHDRATHYMAAAKFGSDPNFGDAPTTTIREAAKQGTKPQRTRTTPGLDVKFSGVDVDYKTAAIRAGIATAEDVNSRKGRDALRALHR